MAIDRRVIVLIESVLGSVLGVCVRVAFGAVEDGRDEGVSLELGEELIAGLAQLGDHDGFTNLVLNLLERGRARGAAILDPEDVQAGGSFEDRD